MIKFRLLRCSFCRRNEDEVAKLVAGPRVYICDECVAVASRIMDSHDNNQPPIVEPTIWRKAAARIGQALSRGHATRLSQASAP
ncbi:MAG TPA: ClpX C4-type zinc finger protein [Pyrinomonadaceae bacterium]|nr:ClpX C4-type zinc finger protein [Pyrinomonadaceae bacterium]